MAWEKLESTILPSEVEIAFFQKKLWQENGIEKRRNPRSTIQSSVLQVFDRKAVKGKGEEKSIDK